MANPTVAQICGKARALLNDVAATRYTNQVLLPFVQQAIDELESDLRLNGIPSNETQSSILSVPALTTVIKYSGTTPVLPNNLLEPIKLEEKSSSEGIFQFRPMVKTMFEPRLKQDTFLRYWWWQEQALKFVGASVARDVQITFQWGFPLLTDPVVPSETVPHNASLLFLGTKTGALAAELIAQNHARASVLQDEASVHLKKLVRTAVKTEQFLAVRRRPFTNPLRVFGGRYRR